MCCVKWAGSRFPLCSRFYFVPLFFNFSLSLSLSSFSSYYYERRKIKRRYTTSWWCTTEFHPVQIFFFYQFFPSFSFLSSSSSSLFSLSAGWRYRGTRSTGAGNKKTTARQLDAQHSVAAGRICLHKKSKQIFPFSFLLLLLWKIKSFWILNCEAISKTDANQKSDILIWSHSSGGMQQLINWSSNDWNLFYFLFSFKTKFI